MRCHRSAVFKFVAFTSKAAFISRPRDHTIHNSQPAAKAVVTASAGFFGRRANATFAAASRPAIPDACISCISEPASFLRLCIQIELQIKPRRQTASATAPAMDFEEWKLISGS